MILITGGAGFIGSATIWQLNQRGRSDLIVVDTFGSNSKWQNLAPLDFHQLLHRDQLLDWLESPANRKTIEAVIHLGACSSTSEADTTYLLKNNVQYSEKLWQFCTQENRPFIYASSAATYGQGEHGYSDATPPRTLKASNAYGFSKQVFDCWAVNQAAAPRCWAGLKFFNVFGPNEYHKGDMRSLVAKAVPQIKETGNLKLFRSHHPEFGDGEQTRDFVYIKDVVKVIDHFVRDFTGCRQIPSGLYNVGTGKARTFKDLATATFKAMGKTPQFEWIETPEHLRQHYQYFTEADSTRLLEVAGYTEGFGELEDSISDYVGSYLKGSPARYLEVDF